MLSATIRENIEYANWERPEETLEQFLEELGLLRLFDQFPQGLDTVLEERSKNLSGGQRQLICFCRALRKNCPYLLLDEPTSSMDGETESAVLQACERYGENHGVMMITHRRSSMNLPGQVYRLENCRILPEEI